MFFPDREFPTPSLVAALKEQGVEARRLIEPNPHAYNLTRAKAVLAGYTLKIAAAIQSRFEEVHSWPYLGPYSFLPFSIKVRRLNSTSLD